MKFINFSVVKFTFFLTAGILMAHFHPNKFYFHILVLFIISLIIVWTVIRKHLFQTIYFGLVTYVCLFLLGAVTYQIQLPEYQNNHYSHIENFNLKNETLQLKVKEVLKNDTYNLKYIAEIIAFDEKPVSGRLLLNIKKDSLEKIFQIDDVLLVSSEIKNIDSPLNPDQFDYSKYMKTLLVYHQLRIKQQDILNLSKGKTTLRGKADETRNHIIQKLKQSPLSTNELAIVQALILGQRKDINQQLYNDYKAAGAIHILAVSGLHIGIVYMILLSLLSPLKRIVNNGLIISLIIVILLWGFAFLTGLSPSVIRAVTMFSFLAFAKSIKRETNSINTLFLSYFILLIINPMWLFHVGFQLSYLAVFFILWLLPIFNKIYYPRNYFVKRIWGIITVTFAAQIGIIPLSLFYFHQFPGLFFLTNLIILPFLGLILSGGILFIALTVLNILPDWLALLYNYLINLLNTFIRWIANQELFLIQDITFSLHKVFASYLIIISIVLFWKYQSRKNIQFLLVGITLFFCVFVFDKHINSSNELIVFHKNRKSLIGHKNSFYFQLFKSDTSLNSSNSYPINGYKIANGINEYSENKIPQIFKYNGKTILVLDSLGIYPKSFKIDIAILTNSPKVNLNRMIDSLQPKMIIADGNNYKSYINRWKNCSNEKKVLFHFTGTGGAFVLK